MQPGGFLFFTLVSEPGLHKNMQDIELSYFLTKQFLENVAAVMLSNHRYSPLTMQ